MERLDKLVNILKLTPHRQPELVKEASNRILSKPLRSDPLTSHFLEPVIQILIQYCDNDDSAQRSLFNDHLNSVILCYQFQYYEIILRVLLAEITNNGSARTVSTALQRIPHLIRNVQPIELGCKSSSLLKALIEIARRSDDESVLKALDSALESVIPYMDHQVRKSKEMQLLANTLTEVLFRNLQHESSQTRRLSASSISKICASCDHQLRNSLVKLKLELESLEHDSEITTNKFVGLCLCIKEIPEFAQQCYPKMIRILLKQIKLNPHDPTLVTACLETLRELLRFPVDIPIIQESSALLSNEFLISEVEGVKVVRADIKVILQANALACISSIVKQFPQTLDNLEPIFLFNHHPDIAIRNQLIFITGNYIEATWRFPNCIEHSVDCERIRKLWVDLRSILSDGDAHPDSLKSCVIAIKTCINVLLESDHCLHIVECSDFDLLIQLYLRSNFKPFKVEVLGLFASLNYRTLHYLERNHWSKMRCQTAGSYLDSLQGRIVNTIVIASLIDEHQRVRSAASEALASMIPNLYVTSLSNSRNNAPCRNADPIVSHAQDLADEHLVVLRQADEYINHFNETDEPAISSELHERFCIRNDHKFLTSSIIQSHNNPYNEQDISHLDATKTQHRVNVSINLTYVIDLLRFFLEDSLSKGRSAISSIVKTLHELSLTYPITQYSNSWDCRPSEYCECYTLLNFLLTYLENLTEPDVVVEDLEAYRNFLGLANQLLYALCHESVLGEYKYQKSKPLHKRQASARDGYWSELTLKHPPIADLLEIFFNHLTKLLWLMTYIIEEKSNPFSISSKQPQSQQFKGQTIIPETIPNHETLVSNRILFGRVHKKLESSFKSSKKNLNQHDEKFYQVLETCLSNVSSLLEFVNMKKSMESVKDILSFLKTTSTTCGVSSLICARQLLKSLFGINILALYHLDPNDWFAEESWLSTPTNPMSQSDNSLASLHGVYHHLISSPYKIFSSYYSINGSQIAPASDKALIVLNLESRRALKVRRRIEERVRSLFEHNPHQLISPKVRQISDLLKNIISEFTPIVADSMSNFKTRGFTSYQSEILHFMSYLILVRVNYQKLALAEDLINSIYKLLDDCGEKVFSARESGIEVLLRNAFTFLTLLSYERGLSKPMFPVANVINKLDNLRAKLSMTAATDRDISTYLVPLLRCLVEDLFIYRTKHFHEIFPNKQESNHGGDDIALEAIEQPRKDAFELLEAERETVAQKLLDVIDNPRVYDLLSILIQESLQNSDEIKYKKLSQHLLSIIPVKLSSRSINLIDYRSIELTRRIIENISPEVFQPVNFIFGTLLEAPKPPNESDPDSKQEFQRWMSLVIIAVHILINQVKEEVFTSRLREAMSDEAFVEYLLHIAQLCIAEILTQLSSPIASVNDPSITFLVQQLSSYILYLTHMFQSGLFLQLSRSATDMIKKEVRDGSRGPKSFFKLFSWARNPNNSFSLDACERMFYNVKLLFPDLTILWCNIMMLLNNVDCNREYWRNLLVYECHHCQKSEILHKSLESMSLGSSGEDGVVSTPASGAKDESRFKRGAHINRPSSLNLHDFSFSDPLRRSFIKKITASESCEKALNRNIVETSGEDGELLEREVCIGNTEQCLSPNIELTRRGALCLVLDYVTISMNDADHITWLIIHYINDIIRWSHEAPITEFISSVHGKSASSGIFIQSINKGFNNLASISFVTRLLWTLEEVHYTQYGSLVVLLVEKLLSSEQLVPYRSLTRKIEDLACATVQKLLNETNKSLETTKEEVLNQLTAEDLDRIHSMLDVDLYPKLTRLILELRESTQGRVDGPTIELHRPDNDSDDDSETDEIDTLRKKTNLIYFLAEQSYTAHISTLMPALNTLKKYLANPEIIQRVNNDELLVSFMISAIYSLALNILPPPTRLTRPRFWSGEDDGSKVTTPIAFTFDKPAPICKPTMAIEVRKRPVKPEIDKKSWLSKGKSEIPKDELVESVRTACLRGLFLLENIEHLHVTQFECLTELVVRLARLPLVNSFILTPPALWRQNNPLWPLSFSESDIFKTSLPMVTHDVLSKDLGLLDNFCDRLLRLGWTSRRQFEETWMTLLGVLSTSLSQQESGGDKSGQFGLQDDKKGNLLAACKVITTITKLLSMTRRNNMGDPLSPESYPCQSFDERVIELTKAISTNLSSLQKKTSAIFESLEQDRRPNSRSADSVILTKLSIACENQNSGFSNYLGISAQKLRMNVILNVEVDMQDTVVINCDNDGTKSDEVDVESCIRLLMSIYKQKLREPGEGFCAPAPPSPDQQASSQKQQSRPSKSSPSQLAPPLTTAICQSILALSDMFTDYEQFDWLFECFMRMFRLAERNEDEIQMQYLIIGLCKSASICCYENFNELTTAAAINHRDIMFEKCRQSIDRCAKSDFGPLKLNALFGLFYMLEDSINIVASGAWELDHFRQLRHSRLAWILKLMPVILDKSNSSLLTKRPQIMKLLESLCETVTESELKAMKA